LSIKNCTFRKKEKRKKAAEPAREIDADAPSVLGTLLGSYFASPPTHPWLVEQIGRLLAAWVFVIIGLAASWLCGRPHAANRRSEEKQRLLEQAEEFIRSPGRR
jgi:hypothetical protein